MTGSSSPLGQIARIVLLIAAVPASAAWAQGEDPPPWRLERALDAAPWVTVRGELQTRFESMSNRLRRGETGSNQGLFNRLTLQVTLRDRFLEASAELIDARLFDVPADATPTTGQVDTVDLLQGYVAGTFEDAFAPGDTLRVLAGRHTMDVSSRRLVARNIFRNTINAFTGLNALWSSADGASVRAFATLPVSRLPGNMDREALLDGDPRFDEELSRTRFLGVAGSLPGVLLGGDLEPYAFGLLERDTGDVRSLGRRLATVGLRLHRAPARGAAHFEFETVLQQGESRATRTPGSPTLDHRAYFHHASVGYTFDHSTRPRLDLVFDMASGDVDPTDGENNRFDTLFGVPPPDYGPTGLYRAVDRSNLVSPGVLLALRPGPRTEVMVRHRFNYLASDRDAWTNGYVDPDGRSGTHIGDTTELRIRHDIVPRGARLEVGVAQFAAGTFAETAPGAASPSDALFGYLQTSFWF